MKSIITAGLAIGMMAGAVGCSGERPTFETQEQATEITTPNLDTFPSTTLGRIVVSETSEPVDTIVDSTVAEITAESNEFTPVSEGCIDGDMYAPLAIDKIGLTAQTVCSGDGKFVLPSVMPGSPTYEEFINTNKSIAVLGHRTAHGAPFGSLDKLVAGDEIVFGDKSFIVANTGMIDDSEAISWLNENVANSPTQIVAFLTCGDSTGQPRGMNTGQSGTETRILVVAVPA